MVTPNHVFSGVNQAYWCTFTFDDGRLAKLHLPCEIVQPRGKLRFPYDTELREWGMWLKDRLDTKAEVHEWTYGLNSAVRLLAVNVDNDNPTPMVLGAPNTILLWPTTIVVMLITRAGDVDVMHMPLQHRPVRKHHWVMAGPQMFDTEDELLRFVSSSPRWHNAITIHDVDGYTLEQVDAPYEHVLSHWEAAPFPPPDMTIPRERLQPVMEIMGCTEEEARIYAALGKTARFDKGSGAHFQNANGKSLLAIKRPGGGLSNCPEWAR